MPSVVLPEPGFADDAQRLAAPEFERGVAHRVEACLAEPALADTKSTRTSLAADSNVGASAGTGRTARCGRLAISFFV